MSEIVSIADFRHSPVMEVFGNCSGDQDLTYVHAYGVDSRL